MNVVFASSEAAPYSKTGGLADVAQGLPRALAKLGHTVTLIVPLYPRVLPPSYRDRLRSTGHWVHVPVGEELVSGELLEDAGRSDGVRAVLVRQSHFFDRQGLYRVGDADYPDNCARFTFFSYAVLEAARTLALRPDVVHCNDWQTGLVPALLQIKYRSEPSLSRTATVFTVHNLAYQGLFPRWEMETTGLDWKYFNWQQMEFYGKLSLLKTGIVFADIITTVSPTYAREIQTPEQGCGLDGVLRWRADDLVGILNGIDVEVWDPQTDPHLPKNYNDQTVFEGKATCKAYLQERLSLPPKADVPLLGMISRMTHQKGFDLIVGAADRLFEHDVQAVFLGTGEPDQEQAMVRLAERFPDRVRVVVGFDDVLAHQIEGGADAYLMPSRFEPCGLNQMYSMRYGTVPIVRAVGGLADTVVDATPENVLAGRANGFSFADYTADALYDRVCAALAAFRDRELWARLVRTGMRQDWSWNRSALEYTSVYERALAKKR